MSAVLTDSFTLDADPRNVSASRRQLRRAMVGGGAHAYMDAAAVALSEIVTNAFVHTAGRVSILVWASAEGTRVEVKDNSPQAPTRRQYSDTAGTGRGLQLVEEMTDRWGTSRHAIGKTVWFEIGRVSRTEDMTYVDEAPQERGTADTTCLVTLRRTPLLMHWAWQEHAASLLREYLLHVLDEDDTIMDRHAECSEAMSLLHEQIPVPDLPEDPEALMANTLEPGVTADEIVLRVPTASVRHFSTLDDLLGRATSEARAGRFLGAPTQPEIEEMRQWLCREIAIQAPGHGTATPWLARTDVRATLADQTQLMATYASLADTEALLLATDEASVIVAASPTALRFLGYQREADLLGRRVIVVVPDRYHQAHIAGTTLNATNGRDVLLGVPVVVPMVRADDTEVSVSLEVRPERLDDGPRVFVARFQPA